MILLLACTTEPEATGPLPMNDPAGDFFDRPFPSDLRRTAGGMDLSGFPKRDDIPLIEEPSKAIVLLAVAMSRRFDNTTDGFVYGAATGLGFGMTENFLYFTSVGETGDLAGWVGTIVVRTLYSALMHAAASSCVGAALGFAKYRGWSSRFTVPPLGLLIAMGIHFTWNGLLTLEDATGGEGSFALLDFLLFPMLKRKLLNIRLRKKTKQVN